MKSNCFQIRTFLLVAVLLLAARSTASAGTWVGKKFLPARCSIFKVEQTVIPDRTIRLPFTVKQEQGEWLWVGNAWIKKSDTIPLNDAIAYYTEQIEASPQDSWLYNARGFAWQGMKNYDKAIQDYTAALQLNPNYTHAYFGRGRAWKQKKKYQKSIQDHTQALKRDPEYVQALNGRGIAWRQTGKYQNAIQDYTAAIENDYQYEHAHSNRGNVYGIIGEYDKALKDLKNTIALDPEYSQAYNNLAWLLAAAADPDFRNGSEAIMAGTKACELSDWKNDSFIDSLAAAYAETGDFKQAVKYQEKALALFENDSAPQKYKDRLALYQKGKPYREQKTVEKLN